MISFNIWALIVCLSFDNFRFRKNALASLIEKDAICVTRRNGRFNIEVQYVHDGVLHDGAVYFTTVDGRICVFDAESRKVERIVDLTEIEKAGRPLGWCRGL